MIVQSILKTQQKHPQNMQLDWRQHRCLQNNSKYTQKQRKESIVQSFIFQGNFVLHETKLTELWLQDMSIKLLIIEKLPNKLLLHCVLSLKKGK